MGLFGEFIDKLVTHTHIGERIFVQYGSNVGPLNSLIHPSIFLALIYPGLQVHHIRNISNEMLQDCNIPHQNYPVSSTESLALCFYSMQKGSSRSPNT